MSEAILRSKTMEHEELIGLLERLFACENPGSRPNGKPVYIELNQEKIADLFR